jgi:hypothetical protein
MQQCHNLIMAEHLDVKKIFEHISKQYYWVGIKQDKRRNFTDMEYYIQKNTKFTTETKKIIETKYFWEIVSTDIMNLLLV